MLNFSDYNVRHQFYMSEDWYNFRLYILSKEPFCRKCKLIDILKPAKVVDHIIDITDRPDLRLVESNCQSLCISCHNKKTIKKSINKINEEQKKKREQTIYKRKWKMNI